MNQQAKHAAAVLTIDLDAVRANYRFLRRQAGRAACGGVLKANAYGLGATPIAQVLAAEGCRHFFVAHLDEGIALRPAVPQDADVFVLHGPLPGSEQEFVRHGLIPVLNSLEQVAGWRALAQQLDRSLPAIIQLDSGMSRLGLSAQEVAAWVEDSAFLRGISLRFLMSHLACAEQQDHPMNAAQLQSLNHARLQLPPCPVSFANSSGIFLGPDYQFDLVRPGAALYGLAPIAGRSNPMQPVVQLQARIIQSRTIEAGAGVGYSVSYQASCQRRIATVAVGYADGWLRSFSNRGMVRIDGIAAPLVGNVSMDTITLDVTGIDPARTQAGALVDLISASQPVDAVAALAGTIGYEILTSLGNRYQRNYSGGLPLSTHSI